MWVNRPRPNTDWWTTPTKQSHECCKLFVKCLDAQQTRTVTAAICSYWLSTHSMYVHIYTCLVALRPVPPGWAGTRKVKPICLFGQLLTAHWMHARRRRRWWCFLRSATCRSPARPRVSSSRSGDCATWRRSRCRRPRRPPGSWSRPRRRRWRAASWRWGRTRRRAASRSSPTDRTHAASRRHRRRQPHCSSSTSVGARWRSSSAQFSSEISCPHTATSATDHADRLCGSRMSSVIDENDSSTVHCCARRDVLVLDDGHASRLGDDERVEREHGERHDAKHQQFGNPRPDRPDGPHRLSRRTWCRARSPPGARRSRLCPGRTARSMPGWDKAALSLRLASTLQKRTCYVGSRPSEMTFPPLPRHSKASTRFSDLAG